MFQSQPSNSLQTRALYFHSLHSLVSTAFFLSFLLHTFVKVEVMGFKLEVVGGAPLMTPRFMTAEEIIRCSIPMEGGETGMCCTMDRPERRRNEKAVAIGSE